MYTLLYVDCSMIGGGVVLSWLQLVELCDDFRGSWSPGRVFRRTLADQPYHSAVSDGLDQTLTVAQVGERSTIHLHQQDSKAEHVHFGRLTGGIGGFWGGVHRSTGIFRSQLFEEVG